MDVRVNQELRARYRSATFRTSLIPVYNCHGMTFASRRTAIDETEAVRTIINEDAYDELPVGEVLPGDIIVYFSPEGDVEHSGIVAQVVRGPGEVLTPLVYSKWGKGSEVLHAWGDCPYVPNVRYYRIRR